MERNISNYGNENGHIYGEIDINMISVINFKKIK